MTKNIFILFAIIFALSSCTILVFEEPMPSGGQELKSFPENFQGHFTYTLQDLSSDIVIGENYFIRDSIAVYISDSLVLKPYGKSFVLSERINDPTVSVMGKWYCYMLSEGRNGTVNATAFCITDSIQQIKILEKYDTQLIDEGEVQSFMIFKGDSESFEKLSKEKGANIPVVLTRIEE